MGNDNDKDSDSDHNNDDDNDIDSDNDNAENDSDNDNTWLGGTAFTRVSPGFPNASTTRESRAHDSLKLVVTHAIPNLSVTRTKSVI